MGEATTYLSNKVLDHVLGTAAFTAPTSLNLALFSAAPSDAGGGTELTGNGYAREAISFAAPAAKAMANDTAIVFTAAGGNWLTATHFGVYDQTTNLLWWGALTTSFLLEDTKTFTIAIGEISVGLSDKFTTYLSHAMLTHIDGGTAYTQPSIYLGLYSTATDDSGGGTELAAANGYARQGPISFNAAAAELADNTAQIQFAASGANWTGATYAALSDAVSAGNMLFHTAIGETWTVNNGETLTIAAGDLDVTLE